MHFREATIADIPQLQTIRNSVKENELSNPDLVSYDDYEVFIVNQGRGWICEIDGAITGFSVVDLEQNNVQALFVHPDFEAKGIGSNLHNLMLDWFFLQKTQTLWLWTTPETRAQGFYLSKGWLQNVMNGEKEVRFEMSFDNWTSIQLETIAQANDLNGFWLGELTYGKEYPEKRPNEKLPFEMELQKTGPIINGLAEDLSGSGKHPEKATINGTIHDDKIWFLKQYPYSHSADEFGNIQFDQNKKGHKIDYFGTYDPSLQVFTGKWTIRGIRLLGFIPIGRSRGSGKWKMSRKPTQSY